MSFHDNNELTGNGGCNDFFATYDAAGGTIAIGAIGSTRRVCTTPKGIMDQENEFFAALQSATTYSVEGDFLEMRDASDAIAVHLVRQNEVPLPTPAPKEPTGRVTAPNGLNVRSGPGTLYPVIGVAPFGAEGEIIGRSADSRWWVVAVPAAPGGNGWVSADFVAARDADNVPIIAAPPLPPTPTPMPTPLPTRPPTPAPATPTPSAQMSFSASPTTINQGQCSTLRWSVENVQAVWVYPQGSPYQQFPQVGQGSQQVCPTTTTTYEMRVLLRDGSTSIQRVTINVIPNAPQNPLNNTGWQVTGYYVGNAVASPIAGTHLTARFEGSTISGNGGCNNFTGSYSTNGTTIAIGQLSTGMMMCGDVPGVMEQEQAYLAALQASTTFRFDGNRLELRRGDGNLMVTFSRLQ